MSVVEHKFRVTGMVTLLIVLSPEIRKKRNKSRRPRPFAGVQALNLHLREDPRFRRRVDIRGKTLKNAKALQSWSKLLQENGEIYAHFAFTSILSLNHRVLATL